MEFEVDVQVHHYDNTPTNAEIPLLNKACDEDTDLESLYPSVPLRTSSILPRPAMVSKGETFRFVYKACCFGIYYNALVSYSAASIYPVEM